MAYAISAQINIIMVTVVSTGAVLPVPTAVVIFEGEKLMMLR